MKINLAKSAGFCFGVKRALDIAFKTVASGADVYMLGDIVHNEEVIKQLRKAGVRKVKRLAPGRNKIFLIRAHGTGVATFEKAKNLGYIIIDATCLMVKEIHKIASGAEKKGYPIIVIGDKKHDEVSGILGQLKNKAIVIDRLENIPLKSIRKLKKAAVVTQSTQNIEKVMEIVSALKKHIPGLKFFNTICNPTRIKQSEIKTLPLENDVMVILGSKNSANTRRLYEISKSLNEKSYWVASKKEIKPGWFKRARSVGVAAGASTPESIIREVIKYLEQIS
jgi:4-hydroxy-3-methylbut-2-en-1-yl diphosphate reductase